MRGIVNERAAAASRTENGPVALRYREVRSRLFLSEMPFGATVVVTNSYSFRYVEGTASMIYYIGPRGNGALAFGGDNMPDALPIDAPFDLDLTLNYDQGHRWRPDRDDHGWYTGVLGQDLVRIRRKREDGPIECEPCEEGIADKLRQQFRLTDYDERIESVYAQLQLDPEMAALVKRYYGLRIMKVDPWECLVFFILSAHNHYQSRVPTAVTANSMDEIAEQFWKDESWAYDRFPFPSPKEVGSQSGLANLQELWQDRPNAPRRISGLTDMPRRIHEAASFVEAGQLHELQGGSTDHAVYVLETMLRGVGPKTAHCVALFGLGHMDAFPLDAHITESLLSLYGREPFRPYAGYASRFLFMEGLRNSSR